jgi:hypothetical protein
MVVKYDLDYSKDKRNKLLRNGDTYVPLHTASYSVRLFALSWKRAQQGAPKRLDLYTNTHMTSHSKRLESSLLNEDNSVIKRDNSFSAFKVLNNLQLGLGHLNLVT